MHQSEGCVNGSVEQVRLDGRRRRRTVQQGQNIADRVLPDAFRELPLGTVDFSDREPPGDGIPGASRGRFAAEFRHLSPHRFGRDQGRPDPDAEPSSHSWGVCCGRDVR
ncbi:hypothetical protein GCM10009565_51980 [Amycolatopsis albidoflavus]